MKLFSRHYGTERFFIMIALCFVVLVGGFVYGGVIVRRENKARVSTTAIYTREYTWSRTGTGGKVVGMFTDSSRTSAFLLLKNDAATTSTTASGYKVFMTGKDEAMKNKPTMTVFAYGPTGYVGFYFKDSAGFRNQVYSLIIRDESEASKNANENTFDPHAERDKSFRENNQIRLYLNFGAANATAVPIMDSPTMTPLQLFMEMPASIGNGTAPSAKFSNACANAQSILAEMSQARIEMSQYASNLKDQGVIVPDLPYYIASDRIDTVPNDFSHEATQFAVEMLEGASAGGSGTSFLEYGGQSGAPNEDSAEAVSPSASTGMGATYTDADGNVHKYYYLHTDYLYPGTVSFAWQGKQFSDGFISQMPQFAVHGTSAAMMYESYSAWTLYYKEEYAAAMDKSVHYDSWRKADGSYLDMTKADTGGLDGMVPNLAKRYETSVNNYLGLKQRYFDALVSMLDAEYEIQGLSNVMTSNDGKAEQNLWLY